MASGRIYAMIRILIPLDGSAAAEEALNHALLIARTFPAELILLRVIAESTDGASIRMDSVDLALWRHQAQTYLESLAAKHTAAGQLFRCEVAEGNFAETIVQFMLRIKPDLLALTRYGRGNAQSFAAGGTAQKVVSRATCSVLLLDPRKPVDCKQNYHRIMVPINEGKDSDCAVAIATMIAEVHAASLLLLHVIKELHLPRGFPATVHARQLVNEMLQISRCEANRRLQELAAKVPKHIAVETRVLMSAEMSVAIESTAEDFDCDLLVLHTAGNGPQSGRRYGSVNQSLIQYSHRPLFILQPSAGEGLASNFRSVYIDEQCREAG
jgi:nucleotide-binding universal stress UspA family protein